MFFSGDSTYSHVCSLWLSLGFICGVLNEISVYSLSVFFPESWQGYTRNWFFQGGHSAGSAALPGPGKVARWCSPSRRDHVWWAQYCESEVWLEHGQLCVLFSHDKNHQPCPTSSWGQGTTVVRSCLTCFSVTFWYLLWSVMNDRPCSAGLGGAQARSREVLGLRGQWLNKWVRDRDRRRTVWTSIIVMILMFEGCLSLGKWITLFSTVKWRWYFFPHFPLLF